jgi:hypothetical protein
MTDIILTRAATKNQIFVNPRMIQTFEAIDDKTEIVFQGGYIIYVTEAPYTISKILASIY